MDLQMFTTRSPGQLVAIHGTDPLLGEWAHRAFVPDALPAAMPTLSAPTMLSVANARAALAALDSTARQLPNPTLLRLPTLKKEAQSTSALEGTYAPIAEVLVADEDSPSTPELVEILNYVRMANEAFGWVGERRPLTVGMLTHLQGVLMSGTPLEASSGKVREHQVVIGRRGGADPAGLPVKAARFVPSPPGDELGRALQELLTWVATDHSSTIDPVVAAAMSHYQFETLHPFADGNGRLGRLLVVLHLHEAGVLSEPTLTVSPWFEARREEYYDHLLGVSADAAWDEYIRFFATGLGAAAQSTHRQMEALVGVQSELLEVLRQSSLRAKSASDLVDLAVARPSFTVRTVETELGLSYGRANKLVGQLVDLGILEAVDSSVYSRRFFAPRVIDVLSRRFV